MTKAHRERVRRNGQFYAMAVVQNFLLTICPYFSINAGGLTQLKSNNVNKNVEQMGIAPACYNKIDVIYAAKTVMEHDASIMDLNPDWRGWTLQFCLVMD